MSTKCYRCDSRDTLECCSCHVACCERHRDKQYTEEVMVYDDDGSEDHRYMQDVCLCVDCSSDRVELRRRRREGDKFFFRDLKPRVPERPWPPPPPPPPPPDPPRSSQPPKDLSRNIKDTSKLRRQLTTICPTCNTDNQPGARYCCKCGTPLQAAPIAPVPESVPTPASLPAAPSVAYVQSATKDRGVALLLEIVPGLFGVLGIGWLYAGKTGTGIMFLIGMVLLDLNLVTAIVFTGVVGALCWPVSLVLTAVSAFLLLKYASQHPEVFKA